VREAYGLNQTQAAAIVGVQRSAWGHYERGVRFPDMIEFTRMLAKLRISYEYLIEGSLRGVERGLADRLRAAHPELAASTSRGGGRRNNPPDVLCKEA